MSRRPNLILFGIDSLRKDHMSAYGYHRLTTPHIDKYAKKGILFENHFSPSIPTTPGYASMLTGKDCFGTNVVALRHEGRMADGVKTLPEILGDHGYETTCIGFSGNHASRGFHHYLDYESWGTDQTGRAPKAQNLNDVAIPELKRLASLDQPFFLFMRHMDPHSPYLPPAPFDRMFYGGNEKDPNNQSLEKMKNFKPFADYHTSWIPEACTDAAYVDAQYDGAIAYMDLCMQNLFTAIESLGLEKNTLVIITSDHGETLNEHDCWYDHHGLYEQNLSVPLIMKFPGKIPEGKRVPDLTLIKDIVPTILDLIGIETDLSFDGKSLKPYIEGEAISKNIQETEFYITECTWMRKHGWRTPEWKLIQALEPDFHFKPEVELYNLKKDPQELENLADQEPEVVEFLLNRMNQFIKKREKETGRTNPIYTNLNWHGLGRSPFKTSEEAYDALYIGSIQIAQQLQGEKR